MSRNSLFAAALVALLMGLTPSLGWVDSWSLSGTSLLAFNRTDDLFPCPDGDCKTAVNRTDDLFPCPDGDCKTAVNRTDDLFPCPDGDCKLA